MQIYPVLLMAFVEHLPESPRWFVYNGRETDAQVALNDIYGNEGDSKLDELLDAHEKEKDQHIGYIDMITPSHAQFHPTMITIMGQINQALTGYGAVSVYGPQIIEVCLLASRNSFILYAVTGDGLISRSCWGSVQGSPNTLLWVITPHISCL